MQRHFRLDQDCHRLCVEHTRDRQPPCLWCASVSTLDERTRAVFLASLDEEASMLRERGARDDEDRDCLLDVERAWDMVDVAPGLYALCGDLPLILASLHLALARGGNAGGPDAVRAVRMIEAYWRHLDADEACAAKVELIALREASYPRAALVDDIASGLPGMSATTAIRRLAQRAGIGDGGPLPIHGIEVDVDDPRFRRILRAVLDRLADRFPDDLARIRRRVSRIERIRPGEKPPTVAGSYGEAGYGAPECIPGPGGRPKAAAWPVRVSQPTVDGPRAKLVEVLAHELGHAVATPGDIEARSALGHEWGGELSADHHAAKWGFGRLIASMRSDRNVAHHGPVPGQEVVVGFGQHRIAWRVTSDRILTREEPEASRPR